MPDVGAFVRNVSEQSARITGIFQKLGGKEDVLLTKKCRRFLPLFLPKIISLVFCPVVSPIAPELIQDNHIFRLSFRGRQITLPLGYKGMIIIEV